MGSDTFGIGIRLRARDDRAISGIEDWKEIDIDGIRHRIALRNSIIHLRASDFNSAEEAERYLPKLACGLWSLALADYIAFKPNFSPAQTTRPKNPNKAHDNFFGMSEKLNPRIDLAVFSEGYYLFRNHDAITDVIGGNMNLSLTCDWRNCEPLFASGIRCPNSISAFDSADLATALDLYVSQHYEATTRARFIMLISALEVLAPSLERHQTTLSAFEGFAEVLKKLYEHASDEDEKKSLKAAIDDTRWKKQESISYGIRRLVETSISDGDEDERKESVQKIVKAYGIRSKLLHKGQVDDQELSMALRDTRNVLKLILSKRLGLSYLELYGSQ